MEPKFPTQSLVRSHPSRSSIAVYISRYPQRIPSPPGYDAHRTRAPLTGFQPQRNSAIPLQRRPRCSSPQHRNTPPNHTCTSSLHLFTPPQPRRRSPSYQKAIPPLTASPPDHPIPSADLRSAGQGRDECVRSAAWTSIVRPGGARSTQSRISPSSRIDHGQSFRVDTIPSRWHT